MVWSKRAGGWCEPVPQHLKLPSELPAQRFRVGGAGGFRKEVPPVIAKTSFYNLRGYRRSC